MWYIICKLDIRTHTYISHTSYTYVYIYIHHRYRFIYCLFSLLISQGKWLKNVIGQQLRTEWCASAGQHLRHKTSHASSEFPRPFKPPWVCGDGGGSGPWTNVRTNETWMSFRFGVNRNVWSPVFLQGGMEVHATNAFIRDLNKGTIHVHTRDQLKVIEDVASDRWLFFGLLLCLLRAERFVAPAIHKGLA